MSEDAPTGVAAATLHQTAPVLKPWRCAHCRHVLAWVEPDGSAIILHAHVRLTARGAWVSCPVCHSDNLWAWAVDNGAKT